MEHKAHFGRALAWSAGGEWGRQLVSFLIFGIIARVIAPAAFGLVATASAFIALGQVLVDQGMSDAIVQRRELDDAHLDTAFWLTLAMGVILALIGLLVVHPVAAAFKQPQLVGVLSWMLLALPLAALASIQQAILRRAMNFRALAVRSLAATAVGGVVGIALGLAGFGVWALVAQTLTTTVAGIVTLWTVSRWRPGLTVSRTHFKGLVSFGWNIGGASIFTFVSNRSDDLIVGFVLGPIALGYYAMAYRVYKLMQTAVVNVTETVAYPQFSRLQADPARVASAFLDVTQFMSLVAFPIAVGTSLMSPELVSLAFGPQWVPTAKVLRVLALAGIIVSLFVFNGLVLKTMGKPQWVFRLAALDAVANLVAFVVFVRWGIVAVAAAFVVRAFVLVPFRVWLLPKVIPLKVSRFFIGLIPATIATSIMTVAVIAGRHLFGTTLRAPIRLAALSLVGALTYAGVILIIAPSICRRGLAAIRDIVLPAPVRQREKPHVDENVGSVRKTSPHATTSAMD